MTVHPVTLAARTSLRLSASLSLGVAAAALALPARAGDEPAAGLPALIQQALAQASSEVARVIEQNIEWRIDDHGSGDLRGFAASELGGRLIKGAPYCADAVHEASQTLLDADGKPANRIARKQTTRLCRDSEGRTRQEVEREGRRTIYLRDPVANTSWVLDPERKTARRLAVISSSTRIGGTPPGVDSGAWRDFSERMREFSERMRDWARTNREALRQGTATTPQPVAPVPPVPPVPAAPPVPGVSGVAPPPGAAPVVITRSERDGMRQVEVHVIRSGDGAAPAAAHAPHASLAPQAPMSGHSGLAGLVGLGGLSGLAELGDLPRRWVPRGPGAVTPLGSKEIEGLRVHGERTAWTIEAGKIGNDKPIVTLREIWTSPDLMLTVQSRDFDPRSGEVSYRLTHVRRGEPDAALFKVPEDYTQGRTHRAPAAPRAATAPPPA